MQRYLRCLTSFLYALARDVPQHSSQGGNLLCPNCLSSKCRRSRRRGVKEHLNSFVGLWPWRCEKCDGRFAAGVVAAKFMLLAHCRRCGNLDLQRISASIVERWNRWIFRLAHVPAYRCAPCRKKFFSVLPRRRLRAIESLTAPEPDVPTRPVFPAGEVSPAGAEDVFPTEEDSPVEVAEFSSAEDSPAEEGSPSNWVP